MVAKLFAYTCGHLTLPRRFLLHGAEGWVRVPVPAYLIEHAKGRALFDSGLHLRTQTEPEAHVGDILFKFHQFDVAAGEDVAARLSASHIDPGRIDLVINSHLHFDHAGGNALLPNADILVQGREWDHACACGTRHGYVVGDFDTGQRVRRIDGEHDVFGDGSVVCIPTYGHTPGHQSLRVRTEAGEFVLCGDACYLRQSLEQMHTPGIVADREAALAVFRRFLAMQAQGARIMFGHDLDFWQSVPQAPVQLG